MSSNEKFGYDGIGAGFNQAAAIGTAVLVAAGDGVTPLQGGGRMKEQAPIYNPSVNSGPLPSIKELDKISVGFSRDFWPHYTGFEVMWAMIFGTAAAPAQQGVTAAYLHALTLLADNRALFGTYVEDLGNHVQEVPTAYLKAMQIDWADGERAKLTAEFIGDDVNINTVAGTNKISTVVNITDPADDSIFAGDMVVLINAFGGAALQASDAIEATGGFIRVERMVEGIYVNGSGKSIGAFAFTEDASEGHFRMTMGLNLPRFGDEEEALLEAYFAESEYKATATCTGSVIEAPYSAYWEFGIPRMTIIGQNDPARNSGRMPSDIEFVAETAAAAPTGFTATAPYMNIMSKRTAAALD